MSLGCAAIGRHTDLSVLCAMVTSRPMVPPGAMSESVVLSQPGAVLMSEPHVTTKGHVRCPGSELPSEAMLTSKHCAEMSLTLTIATTLRKAGHTLCLGIMRELALVAGVCEI